MRVLAGVFVGVAAVIAALLVSQDASAGQVDPAHALAQKFSEAAKPQKAAAQKAEEQRLADEQDMLARARAEAEARKSADKSAAERAAALAANMKAAELKATVTVPATAAAIAPPPVAKATDVAENTAAPPAAPPKADATPATAAGNGARVAILLVLNPGQTEEKRAASKSSPVLCLQDTCYISSGSTDPAKVVARADATRSGADAGACVGKPHCVFRGVTLAPGSFIQIVDMGPAKLIRMETIEARADKSCHVSDGTLACEGPITAPDYRMWLVPEAVAEKAGFNELEAAVADELPEDNVTRVSDK